MKIYLTVYQVVACLACWCRGKLFHHQVMSDDIDDIQDPRYYISRRTFFYPVLGFARAWMALRARNVLGTGDFEPPEHVPRTSARAHTCAVVFRRAPRVPRSREHEKRPAAGREKKADVPKKHNLDLVI